MNIEAAFPSQFLKASDLQGKPQTLKMAQVRMEEVGKEDKPILYFVGKEKGMVLNKTNATTIAALYGPESDDWTGQVIELFPAMVDFQGKQTEAIRVRAPRAQRPTVTVRGATEANPPPPDDSDMPF